MKDYWTEGYEAPCKANNFQSNQPSAFEIDMHYTSWESLLWWRKDTLIGLQYESSKQELRRLKSQLRTIHREMKWRIENNK